jgi:peptide/nickel transport system substrate-binding protein
VSDNPYFASIGQVDQLRKAGLNLDVQTMDFTTMVRRRASKELPEKGGWNVFFTLLDGLFSDNPATNEAIRGTANPACTVGWSVRSSRRSLRDAWLETADVDAQKRITEQMQLQK